MNESKIITVPEPKNIYYHLAGLGILFINKIRHAMQGYTTPRTFPMSKIDRAIDYDVYVVEHWIEALKKYTKSDFSLNGRTVLELGPGADLGVGLTILSKGAKKYNSLDIHNLAKSVPTTFYDRLFLYMENNGVEANKIDELKNELQRTTIGDNSKLNYLCRDDFDINVFADEGVDTVFSQAAFEHFDNIPLTISKLSNIVKPGTYLAVEIDLNTHTRWIRDIDPLNIYRFSDTYYNLCKFAGSPNRLITSDYKKALEANGWEDIDIKPLVAVDENYLRKVKPKLAKKFREKGDEMGYLSIMVCARKP